MQLMVAAMLKNSAILFCDLNTMKGVMANYLKVNKPDGQTRKSTKAG